MLEKILLAVDQFHSKKMQDASRFITRILIEIILDAGRYITDLKFKLIFFFANGNRINYQVLGKNEPGVRPRRRCRRLLSYGKYYLVFEKNVVNFEE